MVISTSRHDPNLADRPLTYRSNRDGGHDTLPSSELLELRNRDFERLLRLKKIKAESSLHELTRALKRDCIKITNETAVVIAELVMFFGLDHTSCGEVLSRLVYEIVQGWQLQADSKSQSSWQAKAHWFSHTICRMSDEPVKFVERSKLCYALRWAYGDVSVRLKGHEGFLLMQKRAAKAGLASLSRMVIGELESAIDATPLSTRNSEDNELQEDDENPGLAEAVQTRRRSANAGLWDFGKSSASRRSGEHFMFGEDDAQSTVYDGFDNFFEDEEESHDSSIHQHEDYEDGEDVSDIVSTGPRIQPRDQTPASPWSEESMIYE